MKKRIVAIFLILTVVVSLFGVTVHADEGNNNQEMSLKEEISQNLQGVDLDSFSSVIRPSVVGVFTNENKAETEDYYLYMYLYVPGDLVVNSGFISNLYIGMSTGDHHSNDTYSSLAFSVIDKEDSFYKLRFNIWKTYFYASEFETLRIVWDNLTVNYSSGTYTYHQYNEFIIKKNSDGSSDVSFTQSEVATLDVKHTTYKTLATEDFNTRDEIFTAYFAIPEEYKKLYSSLYSVSSTYVKKRTSPILIHKPNGQFYSNDFDASSSLGIRKSKFISKNYDYDTDGIFEQITVDYGSNIEDTLLVDYVIKNLLPEEFQYYFKSYNPNMKVDEKQLLKWIASYSEFLELFEYSEDFECSTKTIDESWSSIPYMTNASFSEVSNEYGFFAALELWWYRNNPEKIQEILDKYLIDTYEDSIFEDEPFLILINQSEKEKIYTMSSSEISETYLVDLEDVQDFRDYVLIEHKNEDVVVYRFDICDYVSEELVCFSDETNFPSPIDITDDEFSFVQKYMFFEFQVIDVTFEKDGQYHSLNVISEKQDIIGDVEGGVNDPPPIVPDPTPDNFFDDVLDSMLNGIKDTSNDIFGGNNNKDSGINWRLILGIALAVTSVCVLLIPISKIISVSKDISAIRKNNAERKNKKE